MALQSECLFIHLHAVFTETIYSYCSIAPSMVQVGDIVSVEVSYMMVPLLNDPVFKLKAVTVLRAVTVITTTFTEVSAISTVYALRA